LMAASRIASVLLVLLGIFVPALAGRHLAHLLGYLFG
jgi:hypothetical protein